ncbi:MAG: hypothetical protein U5K00_22215 [Melioribacteraceae bacterium]|nr:hypothetical protein [Melioribacteraceae bacterium]
MKQFKVAFLSSLITILVVSTIFALIYYKDGFAEGTNLSSQPDSMQVVAKAERANMIDSIYNQRQTIITKTISEVSPAVVGINVSRNS